jgi:hypothetical protein
MKIRWYKNGKLSQPIIDQSVSGIEIGSIVKNLKSSWYYHCSKDFLDFNQNFWVMGPIIKGPQVVIDKMHIVSEYYTGDIIKLRDFWPWFQIASFELE